MTHPPVAARPTDPVSVAACLMLKVSTHKDLLRTNSAFLPCFCCSNGIKNISSWSPCRTVPGCNTISPNYSFVLLIFFSLPTRLTSGPRPSCSSCLRSTRCTGSPSLTPKSAAWASWRGPTCLPHSQWTQGPKPTPSTSTCDSVLLAHNPKLQP